MKALIGLDVGTSAIKGVIVSADGDLLGQGKRQTEFLRPEPGRVELCPETHYRSTCELIRELAGRAPAGTEVVALAMAAASGNTLLLDADGRPLTNIISWLDERCVGTSREPLPGFDFDSVHRIVGWPWVECFPLAHIPWFKANHPDLFKRAAHVGMNSDYLLYRLTGQFGMDPSTATTQYLQDQVGRRWHAPYLEYLGIDRSVLSELAPSGTALGPLTAQAAADTGLPEQALVVRGAFDHPSAARGTGVLEPGGLLLSCGTSWVGFYPVEDRELALSQALLIDPFLSPAGPWGTMFSLSRIAVGMDWMIGHMVADPNTPAKDRYVRFNQGAMQTKAGANGLFLSPFEDLSRDPAAAERIRAAHGPAAISRAIMEGAAFEMRKRIGELAEAGIAAHTITMVGGPCESPIWPRIVADVTGAELRLINGQTAGAMGAALLAGIGANLFDDEREAFSAMGWQADVIEPDCAAAANYAGLYEQYRSRATRVE